MNDPQPQKPKEVLVVRDYIAIAITAVSIVGVLVLAAVCIWFNHDKAQEILTTVLPVIGTWVGTVLAFYFSKENLESATRSITAIVGQLTPSDKLKQILAKDKVIKKDQMFSKTTPESLSTSWALSMTSRKRKKGIVFPSSMHKISRSLWCSVAPSTSTSPRRRASRHLPTSRRSLCRVLSTTALI